MKFENAENNPVSFCFAARSITCCGVRRGIADIGNLLRSLEKVMSEFTNKFSNMRMIWMDVSGNTYNIFSDINSRLSTPSG